MAGIEFADENLARDSAVRRQGIEPAQDHALDPLCRRKLRKARLLRCKHRAVGPGKPRLGDGIGVPIVPVDVGKRNVERGGDLVEPQALPAGARRLFQRNGHNRLREVERRGPCRPGAALARHAAMVRAAVWPRNAGPATGTTRFSAPRME